MVAPSGAIFGNAMPQIKQGVDSFYPNFLQGAQVRLVDVSKIGDTQSVCFNYFLTLKGTIHHEIDLLIRAKVLGLEDCLLTN